MCRVRNSYTKKEGINMRNPGNLFENIGVTTGQGNMDFTKEKVDHWMTSLNVDLAFYNVFDRKEIIRKTILHIAK